MPSELDPEIRALLDEVEPRGAAIDDAIRASMRARLDVALAARHVDTPHAKPSPLPRALSLAGAAAAGAIAVLVVQSVTAPRTIPTPPPPDAAAVIAMIDAAPEIEGIPAHALPDAPAASPPRPPPSVAPEARDGDLAAETRIVDTARAALAHGDFAAALAAISDHERRFATGRLREEREAIAIQALSGLGRSSEAAARADAFRARYPESFFLSVVNRAAPKNP
jgi:hypothetical protein